VLTTIRLKAWGEHTRGAYMKFGIHERPTLGVALVLTFDAGHKAIEDVRIAIGCVGPKPTRAERAEAFLRGVSLAEAERPLDEAAAAAAEAVDAVSDLHGSAEYKTEMVKVFTRRAFRAAVARFQ
jgi:carbon-monoxide dehydrogenase medium subunit